MTSGDKLLIIEVAALGWDVVNRFRQVFDGLPVTFHPLELPFPAVTCTSQATLRTGQAPEEHGMICNGIFDRRLRKTFFWEQSACLADKRRIWTDFRRRGGTVGQLCIQQSLGDDVDLVLSPAPIHKHHGGMIQDCYTLPRSLYADLVGAVGRRFNLFHYWGPFASHKSTRWITSATEAVLERADAPDLLLTYLPHLDYGLQKHGPRNEKRLRTAVCVIADSLRRLLRAAEERGYRSIVWGDYAIEAATRVVHPNRALRESGLFAVRPVRRMEYPDLFSSRAVALTDHQVAHVFVPNPGDIPEAQRVLSKLAGVERVFVPNRPVHANYGDLVLRAAPGAWFSYKWWAEDRRAPDYATHVDIHNKIGFDPCELFTGLNPMRVSLDDRKVQGTHGRASAPAAFAATFGFDEPPSTLLQLSQAIEAMLGP